MGPHGFAFPSPVVVVKGFFFGKHHVCLTEPCLELEGVFFFTCPYISGPLLTVFWMFVLFSPRFFLVGNDTRRVQG